MKWIVAMTAVMVIGTGAPAIAQESPNLSPAYINCMNRAGGNIVQTGVCTQREAAVQDDRLNKAYQQVMRQLASRPAVKTALRDQQRRWIRERDYSCKINGDTIDTGCIVTKTALRADQLERQVRF
ncbi:MULTISPECIES: lysozyme inhibitor LprI family protein [Sphingomonas]|jgi:uncharacterized protein YecT (DUF1311 family)|uniref:Lysozyme inhibitor LprI-like N-terminal domain-containing protein n=1 Tax=Sphingomonas parapaucimobilis NBRC 15100 TaxID=1219049 RepID=A0A0A1WBR8_9SPHN|nr:MULTISPECIES: lysozyme inhibitor LprI family protein [Sphingomonas]GAM02461.1 hypothetical protein SP5_087_00470 [Sphingomonas parapaucimobilis NBRC 15100]